MPMKSKKSPATSKKEATKLSTWQNDCATCVWLSSQFRVYGENWTIYKALLHEQVLHLQKYHQLDVTKDKEEAAQEARLI